jgi:hypothetical protein
MWDACGGEILKIQNIYKYFFGWQYFPTPTTPHVDWENVHNIRVGSHDVIHQITPLWDD